MSRLGPAVAVLLSVAGTPSTAGAPPGAIVLDATHRAQVDERGVWRLESHKGALLTQCGLRFWTKEGYQTQANARPAEAPSDGPLGRSFRGRVRAGSRQVEYWQSMCAVPGGLLVDYAIAATELGEAEEVAACFELPLPTFATATFAIDPAKPVVAPAEKGAEPRLIEQDATRLVVQRDGGALTFQRRPTGKIIVQDGRHWGNPWLEVQLYARRAVGDPPGWRSVSFLVSLGTAPEGPMIAAVAPGKALVGCHDIHEAEVRLWASYENPYDPTQVAVWAETSAPSGARPAVQGFLTREFIRSQAQGAEQLTPVGPPRWLVRLTPVEPGPHVYVLKARTPGGTAEAKPFSFAASPSPAQRFLHPPKKQQAYLEDADGQPCFLIGHNYCWPPPREGTFALDSAFQRMAQAGINATRLWLCSWGIRIQGDRPDDYRLDDAWRLDHILRTARERGIYVQLCLDNFQDLTSKEHAARNPYLAANGGPCQEPAQFFTHPKAREQHERWLRYLAARYAPFTSLLAWELFNEVGYATPQHNDPAVLAWVKGTAATLRQLDPYGHPITVSVGLNSAWDDLWQLPDIHIIQPHSYIPRPTERTAPDALDSARFVVAQKEAVEHHNKPILITEFGFLGTRQFNPLTEGDKMGVHLHAALWASAMAGCAGTPMSWWWDTYLAERDLYYHYAALAAFLRGARLPAGAGWTHIRSKGESEVEVLGQKSRDAALLWIWHRDNTWFRRVVEGRNPTPLGRAAVELAKLLPGRYRVEWWDTYSGQPITHTTVITSDGTLLLRPPERVPDVACKVLREEGGAP